MKQQANTFTTASQFQKKQSANSVTAWLVEYSPSQYIALPQQNCHEILENIETTPLPGIPRYGLGLLEWRGLWLPLVDFNSLVSGDVANAAKNHLTLVISYSMASGETAYAALALPAYPQLVQVGNDMICALPEDRFVWKDYALSCFRYRNNRVPILNAQKLFSTVHA